MNTKEINFNHFGILASIDWNTNLWKGLPTDEDLRQSKFGFTQDNNLTYTFLNFDIDHVEDQEFIHSGLAPHIHSRNPQPEYKNSIKIIFLKSTSYHDGQSYIVGYYSFPEIKNHNIPSPFPEFCPELECCMTSKVKNIQLFDNFINIQTDCNGDKLLPSNRRLGLRGYNYLNFHNVDYILKTAILKNPNNEKLKQNQSRIVLYAHNQKLLNL